MKEPETPAGELRKALERHRRNAFITCEENCLCWELETACDRIDRLEAENKELNGIVEFGKTACKEQTKLAKENLKVIDQLQSELKAKDEALAIVKRTHPNPAHEFHKHYHALCMWCEIDKTLKGEKNGNNKIGGTRRTEGTETPPDKAQG